MTKRRKKAKPRKPRRRRQRRASTRRRSGPVKYPIATVAHYGPDDQHVTKIAVGIFESEGAEPIMERWYGPNLDTDREVQAQITGFIGAHGVREVAVTDGIIGCPHEEGVDFPRGQECPYCPFWEGKQGIQLRDADRGETNLD
jgi:hypothetical protein